MFLKGNCTIEPDTHKNTHRNVAKRRDGKQRNVFLSKLDQDRNIHSSTPPPPFPQDQMRRPLHIGISNSSSDKLETTNY